MTTTDRRRGDRAQSWIERNCVIAFGRRRGTPVELTMAQRIAISKAYNNSDWAAVSSCNLHTSHSFVSLDLSGSRRTDQRCRSICFRS
jgi:hypothetical protein